MPAFVPARLRLARELRGLSQAEVAGPAAVTPAALSQFESGFARPAEPTLDRLGRALKVPTAFFDLPIDETPEGFFRSLRRSSVVDRRRAQAVAQIAHDIAVMADGMGRMAPTLLATHPISSLGAPHDEIEGIASRVRREWGVPPGPISSVVGLLESHGVVVIRMTLESADVDAFSLPFVDRPVVVLGSDKADRARSRFDAAHELGHLVIHGAEFWGLKEVEKQAHGFAAAFLMPRDQIYRELPQRVDWPSLFQLKRRWQVSLAALLMRARTLERMTEATYLTAVKAASARGWRRVEPVPLGPPEEPRMLGRLLMSDRLRPKLTSVMPASVLDVLAAGAA
jgi:Zn-dependent peptidase ImmA (M78 family)/transcriptional regulator with XRE-family HTH domain